MNHKAIIANAQPWEVKLAKAMCSENLRMETGDQEKQDALLVKAIGIIREVKTDNRGERILSPDEFEQVTENMSEEQMEAFVNPIRTKMMDNNGGHNHNVPVSLAENIQKLFDVHMVPHFVDSGRVGDCPNRRDMRNYPLVLSALGRPSAQLVFDMRSTPGGVCHISKAQRQDIMEAAKEAGWVMKDFQGMYMIFKLPITPSGEDVDELLDKAYKALDQNNPDWLQEENRSDLVHKAFQQQVINGGGRILYTDKDLKEAWDKLTAAIVQKAEKRISQDNARISDVQVVRTLDKVKQTETCHLRCRIDDEQQMRVRISAMDGHHYNRLKKEGNQSELESFGNYLARTYYQDRFVESQEQNQSMKR